MEPTVMQMIAIAQQVTKRNHQVTLNKSSSRFQPGFTPRIHPYQVNSMIPADLVFPELTVH